MVRDAETEPTTMLAGLKSGLRPREDRVAVLIPSRMRADRDWMDICIHNMSSRGLMAGCDRPPAPGSYVEIRRGTLVVIGRVMWAKGRFFGILSQDRLSVAAMTREPRLADRPAPRTKASDAQDRRAHRRLLGEAKLARQVERGRATSSAFQFAMAGCCALAVAALGANIAYDALSRPANAILVAMEGG